MPGMVAPSGAYCLIGQSKNFHDLPPDLLYSPTGLASINAKQIRINRMRIKKTTYLVYFICPVLQLSPSKIVSRIHNSSLLMELGNEPHRGLPFGASDQIFGYKYIVISSLRMTLALGLMSRLIYGPFS